VAFNSSCYLFPSKRKHAHTSSFKTVSGESWSGDHVQRNGNW